MPRKIAGVLNFKMLLLTRLGEALFRYRWLRGFEKFLHGPGNRLRRAMLNSIGSVSVRQFGLARHDLVPRGRMEDIVKNAIGLATEGFFEGVADGSIRVHRDQVITRLSADGGRRRPSWPTARCCPPTWSSARPGSPRACRSCPPPSRSGCSTNAGTSCCTGRSSRSARRGCTSTATTRRSSARSTPRWRRCGSRPTSAGALTLPDEAARRADVVAQLAFLDVATGAHHCRGTKIIPFSIHNVDEVLGDLGAQLGRFTRFTHWLNPVAPAAYRSLTPAVLTRLKDTPEPAKAPL